MKFLISLLIFCCPWIAFSQGLSILEYETDKFPVLSADFYCWDKAGILLNKFNNNDFKITENGIACEIIEIDCQEMPDSKPISSVLMFDISGSMSSKDYISIAKEASVYWLLGLDPKKFECAITSFNDRPYLNLDFSNDKEKLARTIISLKESGGTEYNLAFKDKMAGSLNIALKGSFQKCIVIISDGLPNDVLDTASIIQYAAAQGIKIFSLTLGSTCPIGLKTICNKTGGRW